MVFKQSLPIVIGCILTFAFPSGISAQQKTRADYAPRTILPFAIRDITMPKIASARDVDDGKVEIGDSELVLGVVVRMARAASGNHHPEYAWDFAKVL